MSNILTYGEKETAYLSSRDNKLGEFISKKGFVERLAFDDLFEGMCFNIINQQLSMKAANSIYAKLQAAVGEIVPENLTNAERLIEIGLSRSKSNCIALCAEKFKKGELSEKKLRTLSDKDVVKTLCDIRGIGEWTAEMTLIFCLYRPDVLSLSDFGIRRGLSILHDIDINDFASMRKFKELYSPYGTTASIYLWEVKE